ncbi:hypothetical protein BDY21DRAFT_266948, partial [Lineolata rhizophorae]
MLLTLPNPTKTELDHKPLHEYSPPVQSPAIRFSPKVNGGPVGSLPARASTMGTPHRGLPPPAAMTLPDPSRGAPPPPPPGPGPGMPPPPAQWQGAEESMRNWLVAKKEEERRKQEEERTRQESLRLEQRKIEQSMLRESMQGGVPPQLVPMIFAGIGGGNLPSISVDWLQQYMTQLQSAQQQQQAAIAQPQMSPELRRDQRLISQGPSTFGATVPASHQAPPPPGPGIPAQQPPSGGFQTTFQATGMSPSSGGRGQTAVQAQGPTSAPRPPPHSSLPKLTTNEMQIQQPPSIPSAIHPLHQTQTAQEQQSSPSIYFHHWVPPTSQEKGSSGNQPATPSGKQTTSRRGTLSHVSDAEYSSSPKKRKAQGSHQAAPAPSSTPQYTSPSFSQMSSSSTSTPARRGHARTRSDASTRGQEAPARPSSRQGNLPGQAQE